MAGRAIHGLHLVKRFFGAIRPGSPSVRDEDWVESVLLSGELTVWARMNNPDRRHAIGVAKAVESELDVEATRDVLAAALLHDSGKVVSGFRTPARVFATLFWTVIDSSRAESWSEGSSMRARLAQYRLHPELGARLLTEAGSEQLTISWAAEHHQPIEAWTVPRHIGRVLKDCDDD